MIWPRMGETGTVRLNLFEAARMTLQRLLMTKHPPFHYMKPGPGFLDHLAQARGRGTKSRRERVS
jgi:hypothetical protein